MARLIDDLRAQRKLVQPWFIAPAEQDAWAKHTHQLWRIIGPQSKYDLPVVLIDNVAEFFYSASDQEYWDIGKDFPNIAPPFPLFWIEHKLPKVIHSKEAGDSDVGAMVPNGRVGFLIFGSTREGIGTASGDLPPEVAWVLTFEVIVDYGASGMGIQGPHGSIHMMVDKTGALIDAPWMQSFAAKEHGDIMKLFIAWVNPALLAMTFLHCRNVRIEENRPDAKLAKRYRERHAGLNPTPWKTLIIEPLKQTLRAEGRAGEVGLAKAMHICRGHFRDYREGRGLFGKYHQLVWTPMIVRGGKKGDEPAPREIEVRIAGRG